MEIENEREEVVNPDAGGTVGSEVDLRQAVAVETKNIFHSLSR